jgi:hypothetical protein
MHPELKSLPWKKSKTNSPHGLDHACDPVLKICP